MKVKWNGQTINVQNESASRKNFDATWNCYTIHVERDDWLLRNYKKLKYDAWCDDPNGDRLVDGAQYDTISSAVQDCFNNIGYPLRTVADYED